jgi:nucleoid-associated protein YgaU
MGLLEKAKVTNVRTQEVSEVLFNPEEYTLDRSNNFAQIGAPGRSAPLLQFVQGEMKTLQMELFFDTYEKNEFGNRVINQAYDDVRTLTNRFIHLMDIDPVTHAPPVLLFSWGSLSFLCVLASVTQRFTMFRSDGAPVRAKLQVKFNEYSNTDMEGKEVKRETADYTKVHEVLAGETLPGIANSTYADPTLWRPIALHNRLASPRALQPGQLLAIPPLPYQVPDSEEVIQ